jgi:hypothetical protein
VNATNANDTKSIYAAAAYLHAQAPAVSDLGMSMVYFLYPTSMSVLSVMPGELGTRKWMDDTWQPILMKMGSLPGLSTDTTTYTSFQYSRFYSWFEEMIVKRKPVMQLLAKRHGPEMEQKLSQSQGYKKGDSWLLAREHMGSPDLAKALEAAMPKMKGGQFRGQIVGGPGVWQKGNDTSVLPAWRRTYAHVIALGSGKADVTPLRTLAPDMGAYLNEASTEVLDWRKIYWGQNYERLSAIKKKYDPQHFFWVTPGVDAEAWAVQDNGKLCRTKPLSGNPADWNKDRAPVSDNPNYVDAVDPLEDDSVGPNFPIWVAPNGTQYLNPEYEAMLTGAQV